MAPARLILWDVDHTLITTGGVGDDIYREAFREVTGIVPGELAEMTGRTEAVIFRDTLALHDLAPDRELFSRFVDRQADGYRRRAGDLRRHGRALLGVPAALARLSDLPGVLQTVLTGNSRPGAEAKLAAFGIAGPLDFAVGAYGTDSDTRSELVDIARARVMDTYGLVFTADDTVIIGDTVNDVRAGRDGGARVIAVATGRTTVDDLTAAGANTVLPDLTDTEALVAAVLHL
jgi:phosphoglycolate phosphatase-like HAD superfamily hydrolase